MLQPHTLITHNLWFVQESALYIREGEDDAKFYHHPKYKWATKAYVILHYQAYYMIHFIICILLLLLAFAETPSVGQRELDEKEKKTLVSVSIVITDWYLIRCHSKFYKLMALAMYNFNSIENLCCLLLLLLLLMLLLLLSLLLFLFS